jgi:hypothetical protein
MQQPIYEADAVGYSNQHKYDYVHGSYAGVESFGGSDDHTKGLSVFAPGVRSRVNLVPILLNMLGPAALFNVVFLLLSFKYHYQNPSQVWLFVAGAFFIVFIMLATSCYRSNQQRDRPPMWYQFTALICVIAVSLAAVGGALNFHYNMRPYYLAVNLNSYPAVNPARDYGQQLMDAGKAYFTDGVHLDLKKAIAFKNTDLYCVAPIKVGDKRLSHYDFWAVGKNCCGGTSSDFRCGQFNNPYARSGLRVLWPADVAYYRLAVQMAEATYNIQAPHPLFFYWVQDPVAEILRYPDIGFRMYLIATLTFFGFNVIVVLAATVVFSKIGYLGKGGIV